MDFPRPPKWKRVLKRATLSIVTLLAVAAATGYAVQRWRNAHVPPPNGQVVSIDGRRLHYRVTGSGHYTFVLEAGLGDYSESWGSFAPSLARISRTFVYDRAGLGWSDASPGPRSPEQIVDDLHRTLGAAAIPKPYILVGHSLGGLTQTLYATRYPGEVAGLLLIDPSCRDQIKILPPPPAAQVLLMTQVARLASVGLPQLLMHSPDPIQAQTKTILTASAEMRMILANPDP